MNIPTLIPSLLISFIFFSFSARAGQALIYLDAPETQETTDGTTVWQETGINAEGVELEDKGQVNNTLVRLRTDDGRFKLSTKRIGDKNYYVSETDSGEVLLDEEDIQARGAWTGARNKPHFLKESLITAGAESGKPVRGLNVDPAKCSGSNCKGTDVPSNTRLEVIDAKFVKVKGEDGEEEYQNYLLVRPDGGKPVWINSSDTTPDFSAASIPKDVFRGSEKDAKDCEDSNDEIKKLIESGNEIANKSVDDLADTLLDHVGKCFKGLSGAGDYVKKVVPNVKKTEGSKHFRGRFGCDRFALQNGLRRNGFLQPTRIRLLECGFQSGSKPRHLCRRVLAIGRQTIRKKCETFSGKGQ
ncbi:MAG: hypothetical protein CL676_06635 [Bdellovibrionaceae bacterium]|nr:hypothetical protein [Pseudobdellovibrionaceae bacterium]|tara:strand:+ start:1388 stop:2458 length:1071 start_codon:yes stop_codon:yes gene_type:complete